ncbi:MULTISPECIES: hypothetical protein [unclassified Cupriavidus]|uniref:hypothetical protein n=1 Tax=Cupriavidus sp. H19C3 TaxID=3241603 RepID=UPI003BF8302C
MSELLDKRGESCAVRRHWQASTAAAHGNLAGFGPRRIDESNRRVQKVADAQLNIIAGRSRYG